MTPDERAASVRAGAHARQMMRLERNRSRKTTTTEESKMTTTTTVRTTSREEIAANVRAELARQQREQKDLAIVIGKSNASTSDRLAGRIHFRVDELQRTAGWLGVPLEQLLEPAADDDQATA